MKNVRVWFEKKGPVRYISHLDLTRNMGRALKLSGLPVWWTEGFNPRIYMTFAMPLSLGVCGERECMDIRLTEETPLEAIPERLNQWLPGCLRALEAGEPQEKFEAVAFGDYEILLEWHDPTALEQALSRLLAREAILVRKHTKKGDKDVDILPDFSGAQLEPREGGVALRLRLPCSVNGSVNPALLLEALETYEGMAPWASITRKGLLTKDFSEFR